MVAKIDEASLASPCLINQVDIIFKIQIRVKHSIFPGPVVLLVNEIEPVERVFVSQNIISFANDNSVDRTIFISRTYTGNNNFNVTGSFFKISANFNKTFCYTERRIFVNVVCII